MEHDPIRMCELLVGLGEVDVLSVDDDRGGPLRLSVRSRTARPSCAGCGGKLWSDGKRLVELVDLPSFGRPARLVWHKHRWRCPSVQRRDRAADNLIKRVKRVAFGFSNFNNYRIRSLLYAGKSNWAMLDTLTPT